MDSLAFPAPGSVGTGRFGSRLNDAGELTPQRRRKHGLSAGNVGRMLRRRSARRRRHRIEEGVGMRMRESDDGRSGSSSGRGAGGWGFQGAIVFGQQKSGDPTEERIGVGKSDAATDARRLFGGHFDGIQTGGGEGEDGG